MASAGQHGDRDDRRPSVNDVPAARPTATPPTRTRADCRRPGVLATTATPTATADAVLVSGPANGTLTLNPRLLHLHAGCRFQRHRRFTYTANDAGGAEPVHRHDHGRPVNDPPVAQDDAYTTAEDTPLIVGAPGVLANDSDVDGDALSAVLVNGPAHGTLTLNPTAPSLTRRPRTTTAPIASPTRPTTAAAASAATVTITVTPPNDAPARRTTPTRRTRTSR